MKRDTFVSALDWAVGRAEGMVPESEHHVRDIINDLSLLATDVYDLVEAKLKPKADAETPASADSDDESSKEEYERKLQYALDRLNSPGAGLINANEDVKRYLVESKKEWIDEIYAHAVGVHTEH